MPNLPPRRRNPYVGRHPDLLKPGKDSAVHVAIERLTDDQLDRLPPGAFTASELSELYDRLPDKAEKIWEAIKADREKRANGKAGRKAEGREHRYEGEYVWPDREVLPTDFTVEEVESFPEDWQSELTTNATRFLDIWIEQLEEWELERTRSSDDLNDYLETVHSWVEQHGANFWQGGRYHATEGQSWIAETFPDIADGWDGLSEDVQNILLDPNNWDISTAAAGVSAEVFRGLPMTGYLEGPRRFEEGFPVQAELVARGYEDTNDIAKKIRREQARRASLFWSIDWEIEDDTPVYAVFDEAQALGQIEELGTVKAVVPGPAGGPHILDFDDGWYVVELTSDAMMRTEGARMHHCVGTERHGHPEARRESRARYFSLRNVEGKPILTFRYVKDFRGGEFSEIYGEYDRLPGFGRGASGRDAIKPKYMPEVLHAIEFMRSVGHDPWKTSGPGSLQPALRVLREGGTKLAQRTQEDL